MYPLEEKVAIICRKVALSRGFKMYILQIMLVDTLEGWVQSLLVFSLFFVIVRVV